MTSAHVLVIGGSGMLADLCLRLTRDGNVVSVIARNHTRLKALADQAEPGRIISVPVDYRDASRLDQTLAAIADRHGQSDRTFCWVHDEIAPDAALQVASHVRSTFWHILGSAAGNPGQPEILAGWRERFRRHVPSLDYRQIVLGFTVESERSRWLTDAEICDGVYTAAGSADALRIVGTIEPWSRRP
jgi:NAD(P)-dependent dehydrogenase (short-subunit alcohol dehydrogenase family)